jgi:tetratricopeptide (TPR) repeat protein
MKSCAVILMMLAASSTSALGQTPAQATHVALSRTERRIAAANEVIRKDPARYQAYDDLAYNLVKLAEETSDRTHLEKADAALQKSFAIGPKNFQGEKTHVFLLLSEGEYSKALDEAQALNHDTPDDILLWGYLADAESALGDYDSAEKAAQWMINIRPGNIPGLLRGAYLRAVWGDADGAVELLNQALEGTPAFETGDVASILAKMADIQFANGKIEAAETVDEKALNVFPNYYSALESLARVRTAQRRYAEAVELLEKRAANAPRTESLYALAEALERAGRSDEAKQAYTKFRKQAHDEINHADNANRELVFYYTDHVSNPTEALRIATLEAARRHDLYTLDAYAWALYANHDYAVAREEISKVLAVGGRDATILFHAGAIAEQSNDRAAAAGYLNESLKLNPFSDNAVAAREALEKMASVSAAAREPK